MKKMNEKEAITTMIIAPNVNDINQLLTKKI